MCRSFDVREPRARTLKERSVKTGTQGVREKRLEAGIAFGPQLRAGLIDRLISGETRKAVVPVKIIFTFVISIPRSCAITVSLCTKNFTRVTTRVHASTTGCTPELMGRPGHVRSIWSISILAKIEALID
ncbi:hypothetical protein M378DRAFT_995915 [Amanita muscaria Koide BX008]|uniref:Uncharacterized protein n=1 Tax=Amanita muscaria (strain Koide BX008) TaxID=946122 RepID=A0A0C2TLN1_AMAMK|nr:hypothetical protein M378DRAFT_995915 [Amanita muscaria Koide BX008]